MLETTMCSYSTLTMELISAYNYSVTAGIVIVLFLVLGFICGFDRSMLLIKLAVSIFSTLIILALGAAGDFYQGNATQTDILQFNQYLSSASNKGFDYNEKSWMANWAQCSIQDSKISKYEYDRLKVRYELNITALDVKNSINQIKETLNKGEK